MRLDFFRGFQLSYLVFGGPLTTIQFLRIGREWGFVSFIGSIVPSLENRLSEGCRCYLMESWA